MLVVSDGWDRGDPREVGEQTARLRRSCHRLIWLNPLAGATGYRPLAAGMAAAWPHIDVFLPSHDLGSLELLAEALGGRCGRAHRDDAPVKDLVSELAAWGVTSPPTARAVVVRTFGSAPRPEGAALLVSGDGRLAGSVSGGCVEGAAYEEVEQARAAGHARVIRYGISDEQAWDVGLACGGTIDVLVEPWVSDAVRDGCRRIPAGPSSRRSPGTRRARCSGPIREATARLPAAPLVFDPDRWAVRHHRRRRCRCRAGGSAPRMPWSVAGHAPWSWPAGPGSSRRSRSGRGWSSWVRSRSPSPSCPLAHTLGYETVVIDGRSSFATRERFPDTEQLLIGWPDELADTIGLGPRDAVAVLTHDVKFDEPAIITALARGCRYVGAVGSRTTQANRRERLLAAGVDPAALARLRGPIGLDLGGREPAEMALSIMSEVVAARFGGSGVPMRDRAAPASPVERVPDVPSGRIDSLRHQRTRRGALTGFAPISPWRVRSTHHRRSRNVVAWTGRGSQAQRQATAFAHRETVHRWPIAMPASPSATAPG